MESSGGAIHGWIVVVHRLAFPMAMDCVCAFWRSKAHAGDAEWLEEMILNGLLPRGVEDFLDDRSGDDVAKVGI